MPGESAGRLIHGKPDGAAASGVLATTLLPHWLLPSLAVCNSPSRNLATCCAFTPNTVEPTRTESLLSRLPPRRECWAHEPAARPHINEVAARLAFIAGTASSSEGLPAGMV